MERFGVVRGVGRARSGSPDTRKEWPKMTETMTSTGLEPRRLPRQERSRQRVDDILDAAAELLIDRGFDAVTTNLIADRAGIPVGSIYQFFPNKFSIFYMLAIRYLEQIGQIHAADMDPTKAPRPWEEAIDQTIEDLAEFWYQEKALPILWGGLQNAPELVAANEEAVKRSEGYNLRLLDRVIPQVGAARRKLIARMMVHVSQSLLDLSILVDPADRAEVIEETKHLFRTYIRSHMQRDDESEID